MRTRTRSAGVYHKPARKYRPDLNSDSDAEDRFTELGEAYETLADPDKRERCDRLGANLARGRMARRAVRCRLLSWTPTVRENCSPKSGGGSRRRSRT